MSAPDVSRFDWLEHESSIQSAGCVLVVTGSTREAVAAAYGADLTQVVDLADPPDGLEREQVVAITDTGGTLVVVEDNGFAGTEPEVLEGLSRDGGLATSVMWNVEAMVYFSLARDGVLLYAEEVMAGEREGLPESLLPLLALVADDIEDMDDEPSWVSVAAAMVEELTGTTIQPDHVDVGAAYLLTSPRG